MLKVLGVSDAVITGLVAIIVAGIGGYALIRVSKINKSKNGNGVPKTPPMVVDEMTVDTLKVEHVVPPSPKRKVR